MKIFETESFVLESHDKPEVDRQDGGHIKISPKVPVEDRLKISPKTSVELAWLTNLSAEAFIKGMQKSNIRIKRINYQDNGNWKPHLHLHLYGRSPEAKYQKFGDPIIPGHRDNYSSLNESDIRNIQAEIDMLLKEERYRKENWRME
jgi:diadenosine tetraphosphate (Ap4A) HIT family hydrolase